MSKYSEKERIFCRGLKEKGVSIPVIITRANKKFHKKYKAPQIYGLYRNKTGERRKRASERGDNIYEIGAATREIKNEIADLKHAYHQSLKEIRYELIKARRELLDLDGRLPAENFGSKNGYGMRSTY